MDTRTKIVERASLPFGATRLYLARGWFDVLTAEQCLLLQTAKPRDGILIVLVYDDSADRPSPLVAYDRAQMVAALGCVDFVCICDRDLAWALAWDLHPEDEIDIDTAQSRHPVTDVLRIHGY